MVAVVRNEIWSFIGRTLYLSVDEKEGGDSQESSCYQSIRGLVYIVQWQWQTLPESLKRVKAFHVHLSVRSNHVHAHM